MTIDKAQVVAIYEDELAKLGSSEVGAARLAWACKGTRSRVSAALQAEAPHPQAVPAIEPALLAQLPPAAARLLSGGAGEQVLHAVQTAHFTDIWERGDALVAACGITESGRV